MSNFGFVDWKGTSGVASGFTSIGGNPFIVNQDFKEQISEGGVTGVIPWTKNGYNAALSNQFEDLWSVGGIHVNPTAEMQMEVVSSSTDDAGIVLHSGSSTTGGSTTTLEKTGENFLTTTAVGDTVIVDAAGATPEFGIITEVTSDTVITFANGLSRGGSGASRSTYSIIDNSATTGAQAVKVSYLDDAFAEHNEIIITNGTTPVVTVNTDIYRVNVFRVIAAGSGGGNAGAIDVRNTADTPIYSQIATGINRATNITYTVPASKELYIYNILLSAGSNVANRPVRFMTLATFDSSTSRKIPLYMPYTNVIVTDGSVDVPIEIPTKFPAGVDIKVSAISPDGASYGAVALRGWLKTV